MTRKYRYASRELAERAAKDNEDEMLNCYRLLNQVYRGIQPDVDFLIPEEDAGVMTRVRGYDLNGPTDGLWVISGIRGVESIRAVFSGCQLHDEMRNGHYALIGGMIDEHTFAWRHESKSLVNSPNP